MNTAITFFLTLIAFPFSILAQQNEATLNWKNFLPESEVDQIVLYNTNGENNKKLNPIVYLRLLNKVDHGDSLTTVLPEYYENKRVVTDSSTIREIITAMPKDTCKEVSITRCVVQYKDVIFFYNKNKLVFILKICMECKVTASLPFKAESKCLAHDMSNIYLNILGYDLFGELKW